MIDSEPCVSPLEGKIKSRAQYRPFAPPFSGYCGRASTKTLQEISHLVCCRRNRGDISHLHWRPLWREYEGFCIDVITKGICCSVRGDGGFCSREAFITVGHPSHDVPRSPTHNIYRCWKKTESSHTCAHGPGLNCCWYSNMIWISVLLDRLASDFPGSVISTKHIFSTDAPLNIPPHEIVGFMSKV